MQPLVTTVSHLQLIFYTFSWILNSNLKYEWEPRLQTKLTATNTIYLKLFCKFIPGTNWKTTNSYLLFYRYFFALEMCHICVFLCLYNLPEHDSIANRERRQPDILGLREVNKMFIFKYQNKHLKLGSVKNKLLILVLLKFFIKQYLLK